MIYFVCDSKAIYSRGIGWIEGICRRSISFSPKPSKKLLPVRSTAGGVGMLFIPYYMKFFKIVLNIKNYAVLYERYVAQDEIKRESYVKK